MSLRTQERTSFKIKVEAHKVRKNFEIGESVRIIQGHRAGEIGLVNRILTNSEGLDSHVVVTMINDSTPSDLTIQIKNLRIKQENDPNTQATLGTNLLLKNLCHVNYLAGELVMYENHKKVGLIIQTTSDSLKVLNDQNKFETVKFIEVSRKVTNSRNQVTTDQDRNVISRFTIVKIKDPTNPMHKQIGEVRSMFKDTLYLWIKSPNLVQSNGFYCVSAKSVVNAGAQLLKQPNTENQGALETIANIDRRGRAEGLMKN